MTLNDWIIASELNRKVIAKKLRINQFRFYKLCRGTVKPKLEEVVNICKLTKGAVKAQDFINEIAERGKA